MASLRVQSPQAKGNQHARIRASGQVRGLKGPGVTDVKLETGRSSPGQGEARRKPSGGSQGC